MKKKIYAVKVGRKPGIYMKYLDAYTQIQQYSGAKIRSFSYLDELDQNDENLENSLAYAIKQANEYLAEDSSEEPAEEKNPKNFMDVDDFDCDLPFDVPENVKPVKEAQTATTSVPGQKNEKDEKLEKLRQREKEYAEVNKILNFNHNTRGNSPWLELLLAWVGGEKPFISGEIYVGRYSAHSLYTGLVYLILAPDRTIDYYGSFKMINIRDIDMLKSHFYKSEEYLTLKERLTHLEAIDLLDLKLRNEASASRENSANKQRVPEEYAAMKAYIKQGNHSLVSLYEELTTNLVYAEGLVQLTGLYPNKDIKVKKEVVEALQNTEVEPSMQDLVMQASAIGISLKEMVIGQNEAIDKLENAYFNNEKNVRMGNKKRGPRGVFLFAGPPGVGKTYTAENLAGILGLPYKRFDMSSYQHSESVEEVMGVRQFWKNSQPGILTEYVRNNPRSIILLDEVEKANRTVIQAFLRILDEGVGYDRHYETNISFEDVIIIMTTNAGKQLYNTGKKENLALIPDSIVVDALLKDINVTTKVPFFPPEIVSRLSSHTIIMFNHLKASAIHKVIRNDSIKQIEKTEKKYGYNLEQGSDYLVSTVQFSAGVNADARNASKMAGKIIDRELYSLLALAEEKHGLDNGGSVKEIQWEMDFTNADEVIKQFYEGEKNAVIAIFGKVKEFQNTELQKNEIQIKSTTDIDEFETILQKENVLFTIVDYAQGLEAQNKSLSIVDVNTLGKEAFKKVKELEGELPVYLLTHETGYLYSEREKEELGQSGIEGFVKEESLDKQVEDIYKDVCCQMAVDTLALRHQILTYETRHELDVKCNAGKIVFYNLKLETAVEAEDRTTLLSEGLRPNKKWTDICVTNDVKNELMFFVDYLKNPKEYIKKGVRAPKGVLMYGPPGTGKTSLAKVVATESGINFLAISADELMQGGADFVHHQFRVARKYAPAVFFIDEIDAIGVSRGIRGVNSALNALLTEMDGFKKVDDKPVLVMAATNLGSAIDPALARRFDRTFCVDLPDKEARRWILERLLKLHSNMFTISEKELDSIVNRSQGMSPAALENVLEAALREGIRSNKNVDDVILDEVFEKYNFGEAREVDSMDEVKHTAYHEAGHALIYMYYGRKPDYMSVVARGDYGGYVATNETIYHPTKEEFLQKICAMLGGRAAEQEFGYGLTPSASADLKNATWLATQMVCSYGMYEDEVGLAVVAEENIHNYPHIEKMINEILSQQLKQAREIIREKRDVMERLVDAVMNSEQKYLTQKELMEVYEGKA